MKTVLLTISGERPSRKALDFAVEFCRRIQARLSILQIVKKGKAGEALRYVTRGFSKISNLVDETMTVATFAEANLDPLSTNPLGRAGANTVRLLGKRNNDDPPIELLVKAGKPLSETLARIEKQRDIVIAVIDAPADKKKTFDCRRNSFSKEIHGRFSIPLVTMINDGHAKNLPDG